MIVSYVYFSEKKINIESGLATIGNVNVDGEVRIDEAQLVLKLLQDTLQEKRDAMGYIFEKGNPPNSLFRRNHSKPVIGAVFKTFPNLYSSWFFCRSTKMLQANFTLY